MHIIKFQGGEVKMFVASLIGRRETEGGLESMLFNHQYCFHLGGLHVICCGTGRLSAHPPFSFPQFNPSIFLFYKPSAEIIKM